MDATHGCWEANASTTMNFPDTWVAWLVLDCRDRGGCYDHRQNASYALVNSAVLFFLFFSFRILAHGPYRVIAVNPQSVSHVFKLYLGGTCTSHYFSVYILEILEGTWMGLGILDLLTLVCLILIYHASLFPSLSRYYSIDVFE